MNCDKSISLTGRQPPHTKLRGSRVCVPITQAPLQKLNQHFSLSRLDTPGFVFHSVTKQVCLLTKVVSARCCLSGGLLLLRPKRSLAADDNYYEEPHERVFIATCNVGRDTKFTVPFFLFPFMYGNGFLSRDFTDRREILHGGSATCLTGFLPFWGMAEFWASTGAIWRICFLLKHLFRKIATY